MSNGVRQLPIPLELLPDNVIGFRNLRIYYIDQSVIEFLQRIRRLFDSTETKLSIFMEVDLNGNWEMIFGL
uniref:Uncharacterized protein n=1 Tax=Globodera rostochiensis TaxID=31243 RepID=A0A914GYD3_GLORO